MIPVDSVFGTFVMDPSPDGGVDLFRRAPRGFVLVDTFDTPVAARTFIDEFLARAHTGESASSLRPAAA